MKGLDLAVGLGLGLVIGRLIWGRRTKRAKVSSTPSAARIVLLGDSITQFSFSESGFGARIAERYQRRADVCVRGYSGYNTRWIKEILPNLHDNDTITKLVVIFFGANDASIAALNPRQHVPIEEFRENLLVIANTIRAQCTSTHILFVTPPPIDEPTYLKQRFAGDPPALSRTNAQAGAYAAAVIEIASELRAPCVDIWTSMQFAAPDGDIGAFLSDGVHLSAEGNKFVGEAILCEIDQSLPDISVTLCPYTGSSGNSGTNSALAVDGPWHDRIKNPVDYAKVFEDAPFFENR